MIRAVFKKPYIYFFFLIFFLYLVLNIFISQFYVTIQYIPRYLETVKWMELVLSGLFTLIIGFLISINSLFLYFNFKERKNVKKQALIASIGTFGGFATGVCSACVAGLFPFLFGLFGVSFSFLSLPFKGMEIQVVIILLLIINFYFLQKKSNKCSVATIATI